MTKQEIANVIRDFSVDVADMFADVNRPELDKLVEEMRYYAVLVEDDDSSAEDSPTGPNDYLHGEER